MTADDIIRRIVEGRGELGFDVPIVFQVTFSWRGRKWVKRVEVVRDNQDEWAIHRAMASVMRSQGVSSSELRTELHRARPTARVRDVSSDISSDTIPYRTR